MLSRHHSPHVSPSLSPKIKMASLSSAHRASLLCFLLALLLRFTVRPLSAFPDDRDLALAAEPLMPPAHAPAHYRHPHRPNPRNHHHHILSPGPSPLHAQAHAPTAHHFAHAHAPAPAPSHAPAKAPAHPPVHPPAHAPTGPHMPRSFIAVQGVVYCKSCKYSGVDTLLGATPLLGQCSWEPYTPPSYSYLNKNKLLFFPFA